MSNENISTRLADLGSWLEAAPDEAFPRRLRLMYFDGSFHASLEQRFFAAHLNRLGWRVMGNGNGENVEAAIDAALDNRRKRGFQ